MDQLYNRNTHGNGLNKFNFPFKVFLSVNSRRPLLDRCYCLFVFELYSQNIYHSKQFNSFHTLMELPLMMECVLWKCLSETYIYYFWPFNSLHSSTDLPLKMNCGPLISLDGEKLSCLWPLKPSGVLMKGNLVMKFGPSIHIFAIFAFIIHGT
jgi:hypothetical protein